MFLSNFLVLQKLNCSYTNAQGYREENGGGGGMIPTASIVEENVLCGKSLCS